MPMHFPQFVRDNSAKPEKERSVGVGKKLRSARRGVDVGFLHDVRWIKPALKSPIHAEGSHPPQPLLFSGDESSPGSNVTSGGALQQWIWFLHLSQFSRVRQPKARDSRVRWIS